MKGLSQQIPPPPNEERLSLHRRLFLTSIGLAVISLLASAIEFVWVNDNIMKHGGWGDIPLFGLPWIGSLMLLLFAILLGIFAESQNK